MPWISGFIRVLTSLLLVLLAAPAWTQAPIALTIAASESSLPAARIVAADLAGSGVFDVGERALVNEDVLLASLQEDGREYALLLTSGDDGSIECRLRDLRINKNAMHFRLARSSNPRVYAHQIADSVHRKLTGRGGGFDTRLAFVEEREGSHLLVVADADGADPKTILNSVSRVDAPVWSHDSRLLAYVSWETLQAGVFIQDLNTGARQPVASTPGVDIVQPVFLAEQTLAWGEFAEGRTQVRMAVKGRLQQPVTLGEVAAMPVTLVKKPGENIVWLIARDGIWAFDPLSRDLPPTRVQAADGILGVAAACEQESVFLLGEGAADGAAQTAFAADGYGVKADQLSLPPRFTLAGNPSYHAACKSLLLPAREADRPLLLRRAADGRVQPAIDISRGNVLAVAYSPLRLER